MTISDYYADREGVLALCESCAENMDFTVALVGAALNTMTCEACGRSEMEDNECDH
jgi:hypothetical protein